jgi:pilus assembly protein Flp/PilA
MLLQYVMNWLSTLDREEEGQGMVEYALILVLVSVVAIVTLRVLGTSVAGIFTDITGELGGSGGS